MQRFVRSRRSAVVTALAVVGVAVLAAPARAAAPSAKTGGSWSAQTAISGVNQPDPTRGSQLNDVAINGAGQAVAAWDQFSYSGSGSASIGAAVRAGGRWGAPVTLSGTSGFSTTPKAAVGADGTMAVSWIFQDPSGRDNVQVAVRPAGSSAWATATLAAFTPGGVSVTRSAPVGIDAAGDVFAAWNIWDGTRNVVQAATKPHGQPWSAPATLSGAGTDGLYLSLAVNARGDAAVLRPPTRPHRSGRLLLPGQRAELPLCPRLLFLVWAGRVAARKGERRRTLSVLHRAGRCRGSAPATRCGLAMHRLAGSHSRIVVTLIFGVLRRMAA